MPDPAVYRVEELAEVLSVGRRQLYEQIREGGIPGVLRIGRSIRISRHAVDQWLNGTGHNRTEAEEPPSDGASPTEQLEETRWEAPPES